MERIDGRRDDAAGLIAMIAANLRHYAGLAGFDTVALARATAIDASDLEHFLAGRAQPCPRQQHRLAHALGVTVADLHREEDA